LQNEESRALQKNRAGDENQVREMKTLTFPKFTPKHSFPIHSSADFSPISSDFLLPTPVLVPVPVPVPFPQRDSALAVPLSLPPTSAPSSLSSSSSLSSVQPSKLLNFTELDRINRVGSGGGGIVCKVFTAPPVNSLLAK
jgi:hypothetical protein